MNIPMLDCYWQYVDHWASAKPDLRALRDEHRTVTAADFAAMTKRLAKSLMMMGVGRGDRVATILPPSIDFILTMIATERIGAVLVPLDVKFRMAELERFLGHARPTVLVTAPRTEDFDVVHAVGRLGRDLSSMQVIPAGGDCRGTTLATLLDSDLDLDQELQEVQDAQRPEEGSLLIFTGGTTGVPKAALLSHLNTTSTSLVEAEHLLFANGIESGSQWPVILPPSHAGGTVEIIGMGLVAGFEMIMASPWSPRGILELTQAEGIEALVGVPTMLAIILGLPDLASYDLSSLKVAFMSGEKVSADLVRGVREKLCELVVCGYGSTEAGAEVTMTSVGDDPEEIAKGYVGKPLPGVIIKVVGGDGRPLPAGEIGEVIIGGPYAITCYFEMPEEDAAGFTKDGFVKTGDLGFLDPDGGLYITGRKKHVIRVGSYTVMPTEIEEVVLEHSSVALAAALGAPHEVHGEQVWLFVATGEGVSVEPDELIALCREQLAKFKVPERVIVREELPVTRVGKVDRTTLYRETLEVLKAGSVASKGQSGVREH